MKEPRARCHREDTKGGGEEAAGRSKRPPLRLGTCRPENRDRGGPADSQQSAADRSNDLCCDDVIGRHLRDERRGGSRESRNGKPAQVDPGHDSRHIGLDRSPEPTMQNA